MRTVVVLFQSLNRQACRCYGGTGIHCCFASYEDPRGQGYDSGKVPVEPQLDPSRERFADQRYDFDRAPKRPQPVTNRENTQREGNFAGPRCFAKAFEFVGRNREADNGRLSYTAQADPKKYPLSDGLEFDGSGSQLFNLNAHPTQENPIEGEMEMAHLRHFIEEPFTDRETSREV